MGKSRALKVFFIAIRLALGGLFIYAGANKLVPADEPESTTISPTSHKSLPVHVQKIKAYIGGLKQTGFFWPMLGIAELLCGLLLVSQILSLLGAVMLVPITLNIFLFEVFLGGGNITEVIIHGLYLLTNLSILVYGYPRLRLAFLTSDSKFKSITI